MQHDNKIRGSEICALLMLMLMLLLSNMLTPAYAHSSELPAASVKVPPMIKEESVSTYLPSEAAPGQGLAVNLIYSSRPRYKEGAPVLVLVPGGHGSQGLDFSMHSAQQGFVELRFAFPGGGKPGFMSSGIYDNRGIKSQEALRDVLKFAAGELTDNQGRKISELLPFRINNKTVGAVGWSNGANILLVTLAKFLDEMPFLSWIAFYESPVGAMFYPPSLGGAQDMHLNKHYRQGTAATGQVLVDYRKLKYQKDASKLPGFHKKADEPEIPGVVFYDENNNGIWEETSEFALPYSTDIGVEKQIYPPQVSKALWLLPEFQLQTHKDKKTDKSLLPPIANYQESLAYFHERDGSQYIKQIIQKRPDLAFCIFASHLDHLQRQPDHPHIAMLYNTILENRPKFLRLNPSSAYVAAVSRMKASTFVENKPNSSIESDSIDQYLEPEGLLPDYAYMEACVAELQDRVYTDKWLKYLEAPLVTYDNGAKAPDEPAQAKERSPKALPLEDLEIKENGGKEKSSAKTAVPNEDNPEKPGNSKVNADKAGNGKAKNTNIKSAPNEGSKPKDWPFRR